MDDNEEQEQEIRRLVRAGWRTMLITRIGELNGRRVGDLSVTDLEWVDKRWMAQIRPRWFEIDMEVKRHYFGLEAALQASDVRESEDDSSEREDLHQQEVVAPTAEEVEPPEEDLTSQKEQPAEPDSEESQVYEREELTPGLLEKYGIRAIHPFADLFPMLDEHEFQALCADVEANGFYEPIVLTKDDVLIDGRNRLQVGSAIMLDPPVERYDPPDVWSYVRSRNMHRRHLTVGQRAFIAAARANMALGGDRKSEEIKVVNTTLISREQAAEEMNVIPQQISMAKVIEEWAPEEAVKVKAGTEALEPAYRKANARKKEAQGQKKSAKRKREPDSVESEASADNSPAVAQEPEVESVTAPETVSEKASREDCVKALWGLFDLFRNSTDEVYDEAFLQSQQPDLDKCREAWPKFTKLALAVKEVAFPKAPPKA